MPLILFIILIYLLGSPPTQNQPNIERATRDATYTDIASHASDVNDIIMIPPVMPRQLPSLKRSNYIYHMPY